MDRTQVELAAPGLHRTGTVIRYGHFGRPVIVFPSERGRAWDYENNGMVDAVRPLLEAGRVKLYCVDSFDEISWSDNWIPLEERARRHGAYAAWITGAVAEWIGTDSPGATDAVVTGCSMGAYHALQFALTRADLFPVVICQSGNYDPATWHGWGERGDSAYFTNPTDYVPNLHGDHLDWLRAHASLLLVCGQGQWEDTTGALESSRRFAALLDEKGIRHELDLWGHDVPHDWPAWRAQIAHHLPRFL